MKAISKKLNILEHINPQSKKSVQKIVFVHVPKCGGTSIEEMIFNKLRHKIPQDIEPNIDLESILKISRKKI
jgi:hypothetical protein